MKCNLKRFVTGNTLYFSYIRIIFMLTAQDETTLSPEDSDSWLNVDPAQLEMYLSQQYGKVKDRKMDQEPLSLREKVQSFLNQTSGVDGVHFLGYGLYIVRKE